MSDVIVDASYVNAKLNERVVITPNDYHWIASPMPGVARMRLDRICEDVDKVTTIVRYSPNSEFHQHVHEGGEEFFVLEGAFADEHQIFPAGTYVRNPIGTMHTPRVGKEGATIFVKLNQFDNKDTEQIVINTHTTEWRPGLVNGLTVMPLHTFGPESIALVQWAPNTNFQPHKHWGGEEILVLSGTLHDEHGEYPAGTWLRNPHLSEHTPFTTDDGALIYVKIGHLLV